MNDLTTAAVERLTAQLGEALFGEPGLSLMEIANRRAEIEALVKDAGRWRHVRNMDPDAAGPSHHVVEFGHDSWGNLYYESVSEDEADRVIDAAIKEQAE